MMLGGLSIGWPFLFAAMALMAAFFVGQAMNAVMGRHAFGVSGNMLVLASGFYLGLLACEMLRRPGEPAMVQCAFGIAGAFLTLFTLAFAKRMLMRV